MPRRYDWSDPKQRAAVLKEVQKYQQENWVTFKDEDGSTRTMPESLYKAYMTEKEAGK